mmetsp:Transcript_34684/g.90044  ORF Transcript_34684/g.90044 Transcript_34684/m.90044 type:complete len:319 (+) Transcript_34684:91-1047(+)
MQPAHGKGPRPLPPLPSPRVAPGSAARRRLQRVLQVLLRRRHLVLDRRLHRERRLVRLRPQVRGGLKPARVHDQLAVTLRPLALGGAHVAGDEVRRAVLRLLQARRPQLLRQLPQRVARPKRLAHDQAAALQHAALHLGQRPPHILRPSLPLKVSAVHLLEHAQRVGQRAGGGVLVALHGHERGAVQPEVRGRVGQEEVALDAHQVGAVLRPHALRVVQDEHLLLAHQHDVQALQVLPRAVALPDDALRPRKVQPARVQDARHLQRVRAVAHRVDVQLEHLVGGGQKLPCVWPQFRPHPQVRQLVQHLALRAGLVIVL